MQPFPPHPQYICEMGLSLLIVFSICIILIPHPHANGCFTSIFSFGDSLADTGNLLHLSLSESGKLSHFDFPPYGHSFFNLPTGRCSDGRLVIDFIAEAFGLPYLPPYFGAKNGNLDRGVNFAVVGATALDDVFFKERGIHNPFTNVSLGVELGFFKDVLPSLCSSSSDCKQLLRNSLIVMGEIGGNDYNHGLLQGKDAEEIQHFVPLVVHTIAEAITELIEFGAVTLLVPGNLPIGCSPAYLTRFQGSDTADYDPQTGCLTWLNRFSEFHNELLQKELDQIRELHPHVNIIYADYYKVAMGFYRSQNQFGKAYSISKLMFEEHIYLTYGLSYDYDTHINAKNLVISYCIPPESAKSSSFGLCTWMFGTSILQKTKAFSISRVWIMIQLRYLH